MSSLSTATLEAAGFTPAEAARRLEQFALVDRAWTDFSPARLPTLAYHVPGRIEVLGKHTDYAGGRSLVAATEQGLVVKALPRTDRTIRVVDAVSREMRSLVMSPDLVAPRGDWSNYPATVARRFAADFGPLCGADIVFASDLPFAAGVSSSSAIVVAMAMVLIDGNELASQPPYLANIVDQEALGGYLGAVENGRPFGTLGSSAGVGTMGGSQDQTAILCSRENALTQYRFDPVVLEGTVAWPEGWVFAIGVSGVVAEKTGNAIEHYNGLARLTARLARVAQTVSEGRYSTLGSALMDWPEGPGAIADRLKGLGLVERESLERRLTQLTAECRTIIPGVVAALARRDFGAVGTLVAASQQAAEFGLGNQIAETRALVELARQHGAVAASAFGAGFGGSVWAMIDRANADRFVREWRHSYLERFPEHGKTAQVVLTRPGLPATRLHR